MHNNRFAGIALIVLGAVFLLPQITGVGFPLWQWWPLLPMAAGLVSLSDGNRRGGLILIAIFSVFLLHNLGVLNIDFSSLWPIALIVMGVAISLGRWSFGARSVSDAGKELNAASLFSGSNQFAGGKGFRGGNVSATFGSADIDLRAADLVEGVASVNASALFGSINLRVPPDWAVDIRASAMFGSIETKRPEPSEPMAKLTVTGSCLFGGIQITS